MISFRIICALLFCNIGYTYGADAETQWHHVKDASYEILSCCKHNQNIKLKVIAENDEQCLVSFIAQFNHASETDFHVQAILLDKDGFEIIRRSLADCSKNYAPPITKTPKTVVEPIHSHYNIKGTFSIPCGFFERTKDLELRFYNN